MSGDRREHRSGEDFSFPTITPDSLFPSSEAQVRFFTPPVSSFLFSHLPPTQPTPTHLAHLSFSASGVYLSQSVQGADDSDIILASR